MKIVCAWCSKDMGTTLPENHSESVITHGICEECMKTIFAVSRAELGAFLDSFAAPVLVVDETGSVLTANKQARVLLQKNLSDIEGFKGGDVFECAYSKLPGGCGETIHCDGCTIRNAIMDTFQSGKSHLKTPAYLYTGSPDDRAKVDFLISTERVKEVVLLRIDKVGSSEET